jgi:myo-inositol-1(or 4)-monophosphatase
MTTTSTLLSDVESVARSAGELLASYYGDLRRAHADRKGGLRRDLVSRADREAEALVFASVPASDDVMAEEGSERLTGAPRCWVVDPLDGTVNYLHGIPLWSVSIGVIEDGALVAAVVHAPALAETFVASAGGGCRRNGREVAVSETDELAEAVLATGFPYARNQLADNNLDNFASLALASAGLRRLGAASLDLAYTACGRLDGFWELHLAPWDVAAGILLVREAGGTVSDFSGDGGLEGLLHGRNLVASNGRIQAAIRAQLAPLKGISA